WNVDLVHDRIGRYRMSVGSAGCQCDRDTLILPDPIRVDDAEQLIGANRRRACQEVMTVSGIEPHHVGAGLVLEGSDHLSIALVDDRRRMIGAASTVAAEQDLMV